MAFAFGNKYALGNKPNRTSFKKGEHRSPETEFKKGCFKEKSLRWRGGRRKANGYVMIYSPEHPRNSRKYVYEHVIVCEKKLGRFLTGKERVHHINGIKNDNREENLMVFGSHGDHLRFHFKNKKRIINKDGKLKWVDSEQS